MDWQTFYKKCCSLDLETNENNEIFAVGAVFGEHELYRNAPFNIHKVFAELDEFAADADYLLGHNLLNHDLPVCRALSPNLKLLSKPVVDTLFLSPLAFPENPYHRLVKNYKLVRDSLNDPVADARLAGFLFKDQWLALQNQQHNSGIVSFYHYALSGQSDFVGIQSALRIIGAEELSASKAFGRF